MHCAIKVGVGRIVQEHPRTVQEQSKVEFVWEGEAECKEYLRRWVLDAKQSTRMEDFLA